MQLEIITPDDKVFSGEVSSANFPGTNGPFEVLTDHAPIISTLTKGPVTIKTKTGEQVFKIDGGLVEVLSNKIIVLAESVGK